MAILTTGNTFVTGDQVTAATLNAAVNSAAFASGAVDSSTTQLSGGAIIVKDGGITGAKLASNIVISTSGSITGGAISGTTGTFTGDITAGTDIKSTGNPIIYSSNGGGAGTVQAGIQLVGSSDEIRFYTNTVQVGAFTSTAFVSSIPVRLKNYTVATLPAGTQGDTAFVTDALAPAFLTAVVGGGAVVAPVFYNGAAWVSF